MATPSLARLTTELAIQRSHTKNRDRLLIFLSVLAFAIVSSIATITASGTYMFYQRYHHPYGNLADALELDPSFAIIPQTYLSLAFFACILIVIPACNLASQAALVTAQSQHYRLAVLRLIGLNRRQVNVMGACEVLVQAVTGIVLGQVLALLCAPLFTGLSFQSMPVSIDEVYMRWYFYPLIDAILVAFTLVATFVGLIQVSISPLGVVRRSAAKRLRAWRLLVLIAVLAVTYLLPRFTDEKSTLNQLFFSCAVVALLMLTNDIAGPFILQLLARPLVRIPSVTVSWAFRNVLHNPRTVWRRISGISFLIFLAAFVGFMRFAPGDDLSQAAQSVTEALKPDLNLGLLLVIVITCIINSVSVMISQIAAEFSREQNIRALHRMGVSPQPIISVNWIENIVPFVLATLSAWALGTVAGSAFSAGTDYVIEDPESVGGPLVVLGAIAIGTILLFLAQLLSLPTFKKIYNSSPQVRTR